MSDTSVEPVWTRWPEPTPGPTACESATPAPRLSDRRLAELHQSVRVPGTAVLSLDCFDTLLWRRVPKPTDLFVVLGEELAAAGHLADHTTPALFGRLRVAAEEVARRRKTDVGAPPEVDLADIYRELPEDLTDLSPAEVRQAELDLERRMTVPDPLLGQTVAALAAELGLALVVVSDTYLSPDELRSLLERPELGAVARAHVVTSSDAGVGKEHGLWQVLPAQLGVAPHAVVHVGNNDRADLQAPRAAGVRTVFWSDRTAHVADVVARESRRRAPSLTTGADDGVTALRGRAGFSAPEPAGHAVPWETGTAVLGPVMAGYADWVRERTAALGIDRALCIMREGRFLKRVMDVAAPGRTGDLLRCELLWASREALVRASLAGRELPEVEAILSQPTAATLARAAASLGVDLAALPAFDALATGAPHLQGDPAALRVFLDTVWRTPELREVVRATTARRRRNLVHHLRAALGDQPGDVALLDIGWHGANQERLQALIDAEGLGVRLHGLYLTADLCPDERRLRGHRIESYLPDPAATTETDVEGFRRNRCSLLELLFMSDDGMTLEIDDTGEPVCAPYQPPELQRQQRRAAQDGVVAYLEQLHAYRRVGAAPAIGSLDPRRAELILERFACDPTPDEARCFGPWEVEDDHAGLARAPLVPPDADVLVRRMSPGQLHDQPWRRVFWPAGVVAGRDGPGTGAPAGPLSPAGAVRLRLLRASGVPLPDGVAYLHLGHDGVSFASWSGDGSDLHRIVVMPTLVSGLLRLDGLQVSLRPPNDGWCRPLWSWDASTGTERLALADGQWVAPNLANVTPQSSFTVALAEPLPNRAQVEIELRGAFLAFADGSARVTAGPDGNLRLAFESS